MKISSMGGAGSYSFGIFEGRELPGKTPGHNEGEGAPRPGEGRGNDPASKGDKPSDKAGKPETTAGSRPGEESSRRGSPSTSNWPTAYAMSRVPTRYGPSKEDPNVMVDYQHPGKQQFIINNNQAYPVKTEGGQVKMYVPEHPELPSYAVSRGPNGEWRISGGLRGGGGPGSPARDPFPGPAGQALPEAGLPGAGLPGA
ncbi:hypothetical protein V4C53_40750, partial [Paraburkholderia azotifigens]|uniref:hypothetical protein n=1 Tax=Paraburkholderia azotifigens TaxID=2057004 RepID=UPI0031730D6D